MRATRLGVKALRSQTCVIGRIEVEHVPFEWPEHLWNPRHFTKLLSCHRFSFVLNEAFVFQQGRDVFIAGE